MAECVTVQDRMCKEETSGYTTQEKCEDWPRQECTVVKKKVSPSPPGSNTDIIFAGQRMDHFKNVKTKLMT